METDHDKIIRVEKKLNEICENHLPHISLDIKELQKSINSINIKLALYAGGILVGVWVLDKIFK
jgi:hypothetical protein